MSNEQCFDLILEIFKYKSVKAKLIVKNTKSIKNIMFVNNIVPT